MKTESANQSLSASEICEALFDASIIFERIFWLAAMASNPGGDLFSGSFQDVFETDWDDAEARRLIGVTWDQFQDKMSGDFEELSSHLCRKGKFGFLVQAATPVPKYIGKSLIFSSGFGHTTSKWFYSESLTSPEFIKEVTKWRDALHAEQKKKADKEITSGQKGAV